MELLNQIAVLRALLAEKEQELAESVLTEAEKDVEAYKRTHPNVECRTGHLTCSTSAFDEGEGLNFVIVDKDYPPIVSVCKTPAHVWVHLEGVDNPQDHGDVLLGYGETEDEAWEDAAGM